MQEAVPAPCCGDLTKFGGEFAENEFPFPGPFSGSQIVSSETNFNAEAQVRSDSVHENGSRMRPRKEARFKVQGIEKLIPHTQVFLPLSRVASRTLACMMCAGIASRKLFFTNLQSHRLPQCRTQIRFEFGWLQFRQFTAAPLCFWPASFHWNSSYTLWTGGAIPCSSFMSCTHDFNFHSP